MLLKGLVKVYLQTGYEKQINISIARSGDFLAFSSVFGENFRTYSTQAITDCEICMIEKENVKDALLHNPEFALQVTSRNFRKFLKEFDMKGIIQLNVKNTIIVNHEKLVQSS